MASTRKGTACRADEPILERVASVTAELLKVLTTLKIQWELQMEALWAVATRADNDTELVVVQVNPVGPDESEMTRELVPNTYQDAPAYSVS